MEGLLATHTRNSAPPQSKLGASELRQECTKPPHTQKNSPRKKMLLGPCGKAERGTPLLHTDPQGEKPAGSPQLGSSLQRQRCSPGSAGSPEQHNPSLNKARGKRLIAPRKLTSPPLSPASLTGLLCWGRSGTLHALP